MDLECQAVLFDMDGVLIDSTAAVRRAWRRWAAEERVRPSRLAGTTGWPARRIVAELLPADRCAAALARYTHIATHDLVGVRVLPGAAAALGATVGRHALVTSSSRTVTVARMAAAAMALPEIVVTADDVERGKPDPEGYLRAARRLGLAPEGCLVVEDTPVGVAAGRAAGCRVLGVGAAVREDPGGADAVVADLTQVCFAGSTVRAAA